MRTREHPDGSIWTRDGHLLVYYPAVEQQVVPPISEDIEHVWEGDKETYMRGLSRFVVQPEKPKRKSHWPILDGDPKPEKTFFNSDLIQNSSSRGRYTVIYMVIDASAQWIQFAHAELSEGDVLQHANNNCIEILDSGSWTSDFDGYGGGKRYKFKAKPAVHMDALRAGEQWTLIS